MHSVEEYLRTREEAREPQPILSAMIVGGCLLFLGVLIWVLYVVIWIDLTPLRPMGTMFLGLGIALILLGKRGTAKYRVTETTRYPQQTGEIVDMYFQILGENYLWIVVAILVVFLLVFAWMMRQF